MLKLLLFPMLFSHQLKSAEDKVPYLKDDLNLNYIHEPKLHSLTKNFVLYLIWDTLCWSNCILKGIQNSFCIIAISFTWPTPCVQGSCQTDQLSKRYNHKGISKDELGHNNSMLQSKDYSQNEWHNLKGKRLLLYKGI